MTLYQLTWDRHCLELGKHTAVMGVVNVTPDSFSDGGKFFKCDDAVTQGQRLFEEGADIIDVGGESTRPYSNPLSSEEECRRVLPVIEKLSRRISAPVSIDTTKSIVAKRAIEAGAAIINDISALRMDPQMGPVAAESGVPVVLMHMKGTPETMQVSPVYDDLLGEIKTFLIDAIARAEKMGILKKNLIVDPGIGFGKTFQHNLVLINALSEFKTLGVPILVGPSRKAFIRNLLKDKRAADISPERPCVETGTQAAIAAAVLRGAHIVRTHNVANTVSTIKIIDAIKHAN